MLEINSPLPIFKLQVGELNVTLLTAAPEVQADIALLTNEGISIGKCKFTAVSKETLQLIQKLSEQIEKDFQDTLKNETLKQWQQTKPELKEPEIDYNTTWEFT